MPFVTVVPAIRTVPGVEEFDYAVDQDSTLAVGDLLRVPFRKRSIPALVVKVSDQSSVAEKAVRLENPEPLLHLGAEAAQFLRSASRRAFTSAPSVLLSWLRKIPKRAKPTEPATLAAGQAALVFGQREIRALVDLRHGVNSLIKTAKKRPGRTLVLCPWKNSAASLAQELDCPVLHSAIADKAAWDTVSGFINGKLPTLVATKLGAWLACFADTVLLEEPENDDFKQDELSPRFDARWLVDECARLRPGLSVIQFTRTPRLGLKDLRAPSIKCDAAWELIARSGKSDIEALTASTMNRLAEEEREIWIIHPIRGQRARYACSSCGWQAVCPSCGYSLSQYKSFGLCRKCGKKSALPASCPKCGGMDFSRGRSGQDRLNEQLSKLSTAKKPRILSLTQANELDFPENGVVVLTDAALVAGAVEDIRRRERLVTAWRRLAAKAQIAEAQLIVQGSDEILVLCRKVLNSAGMEEEHALEMSERQLFGFPPSVTLIKLLVDGTEQHAQDVYERLATLTPPAITLHGPYPVPYRPAASGTRFVIQLKVPPQIALDELTPMLDAFKREAYIDLDPVAFFC